MSIRFADLEVVTSRYELPEINTASDDVFGALRFILEVLKRHDGVYVPRLLRKEYATVDVAYAARELNEPTRTVCEVVAIDDSFDWSALASSTEQEAIDKVLAQINEAFLLKP